jgi:serine protease AprX
MSQLNERGARSERSSALWGTGGRGGDRSSVLWGKGGRGMLVASIAAVALAAPLAATASPGKKPAPKPAPTPVTAPVPAPATDPAPPDASNGKDKATWVARGLLDKAKNAPSSKIDVIITSSGGTTGSDRAFKWLAKLAAKSGDVSGESNLNLIGGITATLPARLVARLQTVPGLTVTPDAPVRISGSTKLTSSQLWPYESGNADMWAGDQQLYSGKFPAIAVVDSGVQSRADFGNRIVASVNLSTLAGNTSTDDERGHGTFVAGIAAGAGAGLTGAAPGAPIVSIKVMDANGMAKTSDVINACQWILDHKSQYNIKVANFSLHSSYGTNSYRDPLDQAVERLWFNGVTVVAAAGNYGTSSTTPSGVLYAPGNDPFVITVGAVDLGGTSRSNDDSVAPWSAWGYTEDGFYKPDISAPGRYMVGPVPAGSTISQQKASNMIGTDRIQLSGTSFAAPVVAGTVAQMLARHPNWSPDQVKGALMRTARAVHNGNPKAAGLGELTASRAAATNYAPNPNLGLEQFMKPAANGNGQVFDAQSWANSAKANMSWNSMSWNSQSWSDMSWTDQSWSDMSWTDMSWNSMSWTDMSWTDMSWTDMSNEDVAEGDDLAGAAGYVATPEEILAALTDPNHVDVDGLPSEDPVVVPTDPPVDPAATPTDPPADPAATPTDPPADPAATPTDPPADPAAPPADPPADPPVLP